MKRQRGGISFHTNIDITSTMAGHIVLSDSDSDSSFSWTVATQAGTAGTVTTLDGLDPREVDFDLSEQYRSDTVIEYVCADTALQMAGYLYYQFIWVYLDQSIGHHLHRLFGLAIEKRAFETRASEYLFFQMDSQHLIEGNWTRGVLKPYKSSIQNGRTTLLSLRPMAFLAGRNMKRFLSRVVSTGRHQLSS